MTFSGPVRGDALPAHPLLGRRHAGRGTINNCANGTMPWGTYLTCEENWAGYFRRNAGDAAVRTACRQAQAERLARPLRHPGAAHRQLRLDDRDARRPDRARSSRAGTSPRAPAAADGTGDFRNEAFQFGWVVEIDPFDPASTPRKRTALGRMNHEGCLVGRIVAGVQPAFYMGDDAQNEYIYKFVSAHAVGRGRRERAPTGSRSATSISTPARSTSHASTPTARACGCRWCSVRAPLTAANAAYPFADQADVLINARLAADALGATRMDRPEWTAVNPVTGEMYLHADQQQRRARARQRPMRPTRAPTTIRRPTAARPARQPQRPHHPPARDRRHVARRRPSPGTSMCSARARTSTPPTSTCRASTRPTTSPSPDGLWFGAPSNAAGQVKPLLWIQTDDGAYTDVTNCMMLAAHPRHRRRRRHAQRSPTRSGGATGTGHDPHRQGAGRRRCAASWSDRRSARSPASTTTPDGRSLFVNIQHPGENGSPADADQQLAREPGGRGTGARPRSATIVITKNDGGVVGL